MTFWQWLYKIGPGWPSERQWVTAAVFVSFWIMLQMAVDNPSLWDVKLFEVVFQAISISGIIGMILAFFYAANKSDEEKTHNTAAAFRAIEATANATGLTAPGAIQDGDTVTVEKKP